MRASQSRWVLSALIRPALWFCACNLLVTAGSAQCTNPTQVPNGTYTSGDHSQVDNNALSASNFAVSQGATATFAAGNCVHLAPGFRANAIGATVPTTFQTWVDIAPTAESVSPSSPPPDPPLTQAFTWTVSSPAGQSNLSHVFALFNTTSTSTANACYIHYDASTNLVYLADNASTDWLGGFVPSSSGSATNSQCTIAGTGASPNPTSAGTQLGLTLNVTFNAVSFSGNKNAYLYALDGSGVSTGWQQMGTWTVPAPPAPDFTLTAVSNTYYVQTGVYSYPSYTLIVTPQNGFNSPVSFSMSWPMYNCGYPSYNPSQVTGPPWTTTVSMQCYQPYQNVYWTQVTASGGGKSRTLILYLNAGAPPLSIMTATLPNAAVGTYYSASLVASGGSSPFYSWSLYSGSLPSGLSLSSGGIISGTPTAAGTANFTVRVSDGTSSTTQALTLTVSPGALTITTSSLSNATVGVAYSAALAATGGTPPYSWSLYSGTLPFGLSLSSGGIISGTPDAVTTATFTARVTDSASATNTRELTLIVSSSTLTITTTTLSDATVGAPYSASLTATGGTTPQTWSLVAGSGGLPAGLSLSDGGTISGTPTAIGTSDFEVKVTDVANVTATKQLRIVVHAAGTYSISGRVTIGSCPLSGVTIELTGGGNPPAQQTDATGAYSFGGLVPATYTVTPSKTGYTFAPAPAPFSLTENQTKDYAATGPALPSREYIRMGGRVVALAECGVQ